MFCSCIVYIRLLVRQYCLMLIRCVICILPVNQSHTQLITESNHSGQRSDHCSYHSDIQSDISGKLGFKLKF